MPSPDHITPAREERIRSVLERRQPTLTVVFENMHDPHNMGAVLRTCDAVGVLEAHCIYSGRQVFPELLMKTARGARKWVDLYQHDSVAGCFGPLKEHGFTILTTHMSRDARSVYDVDYTGKIALVFGNEHDGVSQEAVAAADGNILVPQVGMVNSLNVSVACAVVLHEAMRQRLAAGMYDRPQLSVTDLHGYVEDWKGR